MNRADVFSAVVPRSNARPVGTPFSLQSGTSAPSTWTSDGPEHCSFRPEFSSWSMRKSNKITSTYGSTDAYFEQRRERKQLKNLVRRCAESGNGSPPTVAKPKEVRRGRTGRTFFSAQEIPGEYAFLQRMERSRIKEQKPDRASRSSSRYNVLKPFVSHTKIVSERREMSAILAALRVPTPLR